MSRWYITVAIFTMKKCFVILSALVLIAFSGCKKAGAPITKDFGTVGPYTELQVEDGFDVSVSNTATQVTVTAGENIMPNVVVQMEGNKLRIYIHPKVSVTGPVEKTVILPYNPDLTTVRLSGASSFYSIHGLEGQRINIDLSGASNFSCSIDADEVDMDLSGASGFIGNIDAYDVDADLSGASDIRCEQLNAFELDLDMSGASYAFIDGQAQVGSLKIELEGASEIVRKVRNNRYVLACDICEGRMSGSSRAYIHCDGSIAVNLSGGSDLHYSGDAATGGCTLSGGSIITHDNP